MTHHVPIWDHLSQSLKVFDHTSFFHTTKRGLYLHPHQHSLQEKSFAAQLVPNQNIPESVTQMALQEEVGAHLTGDARDSVPALDMPNAVSNHEDEMLLWLQYPLEDSFDRNYCSEFFGELANPQVHLVKNAFVHQTMRDTESTHELTVESMGREHAGPEQLVNASSVHHSRQGVNSDVAMSRCAGRVAGLVPQAGLEAFAGLHTHVHSSPSSVAKPFLEDKKSFETYDPILSSLDGKKPLSTIPPVSSGFNFSAFSRPIATTLDNLRTVGAVSGPTNVERVRQPLTNDSSFLCEPSTGVMNMHPFSQQSTGFSSQVKMVRDGGGSTANGCSLPTNPPCGQAAYPCRPDMRLPNETAELSSHVTCLSGNAISASENVFETAETTSSHSRLSGSSIEEIAEKTFTSTSTKKLSAESVEEVENVAAYARKPPSGPRATKRGRAAETHNESEKKRRNKINIRLKTLQSLIPNSNKTDKASVLDEAIEYTKMLQAQLQFMSMRTGVFVPQMMMPSALHYVPMHQMPLSYFGMGLGFGMGSDMGISMRTTDINATTTGLDASVCVTGASADAGAVFNLSPTTNISPPRQVRAGFLPQQPASVPFVHDVSFCLPASCSSEPYKMMLAQQPLQPMLVNMQVTPDMYNAFVQPNELQANHMSDLKR